MNTNTKPVVFGHESQMYSVLNVAENVTHIETDVATNNLSLFIAMLEAQRNGKTCLPKQLGLSEQSYQALQYCVTEEYTALLDLSGDNDEEDVRQSLLEMRRDEWNDIRSLLIENRASCDETEIWMSEIVAAGCLGGDHLWRDLGLSDRALLSMLLEMNFPALASKNTQDMKWKKFFYKQLCDREGSYVCRAPSCEECTAYDDCFGPEV